MEMVAMETLVMPVSPELQTLIETRLDLVDRVLLDARVPRSERTGILQELEAQILEQLERRTSQPTREDLLAVLAALDPPEAFLADDEDAGTATIRPQRAPHRVRVSGGSKFGSSDKTCGLALWAGLLVAGTSLVTGFLMSTVVWIVPEVMLTVVAVLQVAALTGAALGCASLLRRAAVPSPGLERLVAGVAAGTGALTLMFLLLLASVFVLDSELEIGVFVLAGFVGGAWIHGAWLAAATGALWLRRA
jgi:hypothetical protein